MPGLYESLFGPPEGSANAYVQNNYPSDGMHLLHATRPETFYTPPGMKPPPGGRGPTIGEDIEGAPDIYKMLPFLMSLMQERGRR